MPSLFKLAGPALYVRDVLRLDRLLEAAERRLYRRLLVSRDLVAIFLEILLGLEAECVSVVDLVYPLLLGLVRSLVGLGFIPHTLDLILAQA